ncbi:glycosyltransferase family protein [Algivirga pacifica]|uniref:Glycosyltransferase family protein n=1 Tax=Algivirga pacifica TaxID=1162670 RepID=A0ABP9DKH3_9BACT
MKILYAIQGTGNGHISRARAIIPELQKYSELDVLISGTQAEVTLPYPIKYRVKGAGFVFGKRGGVDLMETAQILKPVRFRKELMSIPVEEYDLVINDFEPVSAWAAYLKNVPCVSLSHQAAVLTEGAPLPSKNSWFGKSVLNYYAPTQRQYGFHFETYNQGIFTPVIRPKIRNSIAENKGHYTVYLPSYSDQKIIKYLSKIKEVRWEVFSKHCNQAFADHNVFVQPITDDAFVKSLTGAEGVLCGAGFELPSEALFLKKKLMVIPMQKQFEQQCNAAALGKLGVPVIKKLKKKYLPLIQDWVNASDRVEVNYPDQTEEVIQQVLSDFIDLKHEMAEVSWSHEPIPVDKNELVVIH